MSGSPWTVPAVGAAEAAGGSLALWRQAQAQMDQLAAPASTPTASSPDARHDDAALAQAVPQTPNTAQAQPATPHRLSSLQLDPTHLARSLRPNEEPSRSASRDSDDADHSTIDRDAPSSSASAALDPEHWLPALARRWSRSESAAARQALQLAQAQWSQGRRVLLACSATGNTATTGPTTANESDGWAALLMGRAARAGGAMGLTLDGPRWPIRLSWRDGLPAEHWSSTRAVKQAAGLAWQMTPVLEAGVTRADVALLIGPALEVERRWERLGIRLPHGAGFRATLGAQWSLTLIATRGCWMDR